MSGADKNFRVSRDPKEILGTLERVKNKKVLLWYQAEQQRKQLSLSMAGIDLKTRKMFFALHAPLGSLSVNDFCYLKVGEEDCVGKCRVDEISAIELVLDFPEEMVYREFRRSKRHRFKKSDGKQVQIQIKSNSIGVGVTPPKWYEVLDVSDSGMGLFVPEKEISPFLDEVRLQINQISEYRIEQPFIGEIVRRNRNDRKTDFGQEKGYKISIRLDRSIPDEIFQDFVFIEKMLSLDPGKFFRDREFREKVHQNMEKTVDKLASKLDLGSKLRLLEIKRDGNQYLKLHIELLSEMTCELGRKLGWITESTAEKMIYCSFLHDVRYFEKPHLARLKFPMEFNRQRENMSEEDIATFLEGPHYAMEIAKDDDSASPDCQKILIQQRELPDGSGFPNGVRGAHMAPLSCLFILSHELVDHILEDEKWTIEGFLAKTRPVYKGGYYTKILTAIEEWGTGIQPS